MKGFSASANEEIILSSVPASSKFKELVFRVQNKVEQFLGAGAGNEPKTVDTCSFRQKTDGKKKLNHIQQNWVSLARD